MIRAGQRGGGAAGRRTAGWMPAGTPLLPRGPAAPLPRSLDDG